MADKSDFYSEAASARANQIEAELAAVKADITAHRANGDLESATGSIQQLADLEAQRQNLLNLHQQYIASQRAPVRPEQSREEWAVKPVDRMDWQDALEVARQSRYGRDLNADDPLVRAGFAEAARRRQRGE